MSRDNAYIICNKCGNVMLIHGQETENVICSKCFDILVNTDSHSEVKNKFNSLSGVEND